MTSDIIRIDPPLPCCVLVALRRRCNQPASVAVVARLGDGSYHMQPFVGISLTTPMIQMPVAQAREIAIQILEAVEAARMDGFVIRFANEMDGSEQSAAMLLSVFRSYRSSEQGDQES